jgi:hypothetical protein
MKLKLKLAALAVSTGLIAFASGACFARWFGDLVGDHLWFRYLK